MEAWTEFAKTLFGITLSASQIDQFCAYEDLLIEWNEKINLTALRTREEIQIKHFLDSLSCAPFLIETAGKKMIDIGTGAGFPGIPLKILYPDLAVTVADSTRKKITFCQIVIDALALQNIQALCARSEDLGRTSHTREKFDFSVARAVANLPILCEFLLPLTKLNGFMIAQKGITAKEEVQNATTAICRLGGGTPTLHDITLPNVTSKRAIILIEKIRPTPKNYPRSVGIPAKQPLVR